MAPIGGGPPVGSTSGAFTGAAEALELIGAAGGNFSHAYAYSGVINDNASGSAAALALKFTSGNYYFVGVVDMITDTLLNDQRYLDVTFNGVSVFKGSWDNEPYAIAGPVTNLIIPPYTEVEVKWGSSGNKNATIVLTGRVYRS